MIPSQATCGRCGGTGHLALPPVVSAILQIASKATWKTQGAFAAELREMGLARCQSRIGRTLRRLTTQGVLVRAPTRVGRQHAFKYKRGGK